MRLAFAILATVVALVVAACEEDSEDFGPHPFEVRVTFSSEGVTLDPQRVESNFVFLNISNETDEARILSVRVHGDQEKLLEFGLAPGESRSELVEARDERAVTLYWADDMLHVQGVEPLPTPILTPRSNSCPYSGDPLTGYVEGYFEGLVLELQEEQGEPFPDSYLSNYALGYRGGYVEGLADAHFRREKEIVENLEDYVVAYARGYTDGHDDGYEGDGYEAMTSSRSRLSQDYRDGYFEGFFDAISDEESLCP